MATDTGFWSFHVVPHLIRSGAIDGPMAAGNKTIQRLRWLFLAMQVGISTYPYCNKLANNLLMHEDMFGESDTDESETSDTMPGLEVLVNKPVTDI